MTNPTRFIIPIALLIASGAASAHPGRGAALERLDVDGDQRLSAEEVGKAPRLAGQFEGIDANRDGYLDRDELKAWAAQRRASREEARLQRFAQMDTDGNGVIDAAELGAPRLARQDANGDGVLDADEFSQAPRGRGRHGRH